MDLVTQALNFISRGTAGAVDWPCLPFGCTGSSLIDHGSLSQAMLS